MNYEVDVVRAVRDAYARVEAGGLKSQTVGQIAHGGQSSNELAISIMQAKEIIMAVATLEARFNLVLMARVNDGSMQFLSGIFEDLVSVTKHYGSGVLKYGDAGLRYWVAYWLTGIGSTREFGQMYGVAHETASVFYRDHVKSLLQGWFTAARGAVEPVLLRQLDANCLEAA